MLSKAAAVVAAEAVEEVEEARNVAQERCPWFWRGVPRRRE